MYFYLRSMQLRYGVFCLKSHAIVLLIYGSWALLYDFGRRYRYDIIYDVIYANEACNAAISRHMAGTGSSPVRT